ncbi:MAG TPA: TIGR03086 family metal-binding protein [Streptosporangiaceae bacterium]|nr:TIGR03086 family metal-binding protein [Streptosporangiaceae bacterium]
MTFGAAADLYEMRNLTGSDQGAADDDGVHQDRGAERLRGSGAVTWPAAPRGAPGPGTALLRSAIRYALGAADAITPALLRRPTPCRGWDLGMLLRHVNESLAGLREATGSGRVGAWPAREPPAHDLTSIFRDRARELAETCDVCDHADRVIGIGDRVITLRTVAMLGALEVALHGWDVSRACGPARPIPAALAADLLEVAPLLVGEFDRAPLFAPPVTPSPGAGPSDRLAAFLGRDPLA